MKSFTRIVAGIGLASSLGLGASSCFPQFPDVAHSGDGGEADTLEAAIDATDGTIGDSSVADGPAFGEAGLLDSETVADSAVGSEAESLDAACNEAGCASQSCEGGSCACPATQHVCQDGGCFTGPCLPFSLAPLAAQGPLLLDSSAIYAVVGGHPTAIGINSGTTIATSAIAIPSLLTQSSANLYASTGNPFYRLDKTALAASAILDMGGSGGYLSAAVAGSYLWVWQNGGGVLDVLSPYALDGTTMNVNASAPGSQGCEPLAADALGIVYGTQLSNSMLGNGNPGLGPCNLYAAGPAEGNPTQLQVPTGAVVSLVVLDQSNAYWFNTTDNVLYASARDGSRYTHLISSALAHAPIQLALDATDLYWTDSTAGTVMAVPLAVSDGVAKTIATGQTSAGGIVADSTAIYWATASALVKMIK